MEHRHRSTLALGILLVLIGAALLAIQFVPEIKDWVYGQSGWPLIIVAVGAAFLVFGLFAGVPGMAVPAFIIGGIGGLLWYQNAYHEWESWAYAWTLIPGFVGLGTIADGLLSRRRGEVGAGLWLLVISFVLFVVFGSFPGGPAILGTYWPVTLIVLGVAILIERLVRRA